MTYRVAKFEGEWAVIGGPEGAMLFGEGAKAKAEATKAAKELNAEAATSASMAGDEFRPGF